MRRINKYNNRLTCRREQRNPAPYYRGSVHICPMLPKHHHTHMGQSVPTEAAQRLEQPATLAWAPGARARDGNGEGLTGRVQWKRDADGVGCLWMNYLVKGDCWINYKVMWTYSSIRANRPDIVISSGVPQGSILGPLLLYIQLIFL